MGKRNKRPQVAYNIPQEKKPRFASEEDDADFCWRTAHADLSESQWGWGCISLSHLFQEIAPKLHEFEKSTWGQMIGCDRVHFFPQNEIAREAQKRLDELVKNDVIPEDWYGEDLTAIRITAKARIWGFKVGKCFFLLWWDPEHTVYPVRKQHT